MTKKNSVYAGDLASDVTYDLTSQSYRLSRVALKGHQQPPAARVSRPDVARGLVDPESRRRALRFGLMMVVGQNEALLASPRRLARKR